MKALAREIYLRMAKIITVKLMAVFTRAGIAGSIVMSDIDRVDGGGC
jgi:hypothetical protein